VDSYGRSVESAVKEYENQSGDADIEGEILIIEKDPADALLAREHPKRKKCEQCWHAEHCRGPVQEYPYHQECSKHRQVSCNSCRHRSIVGYANSLNGPPDLPAFAWNMPLDLRY
jgi:hypothetical protein